MRANWYPAESQTELGLSDRHIAEEIKKYPLAKEESLFHMRMENGQMTFVDESIDPRFFGRVVLLTENGLVRSEEEIPMEKIVQVRREAKRKVFVTNAFRALRKVAPDHNLRNISTVVLGRRIGRGFRDTGDAYGGIYRLPHRLRARKYPAAPKVRETPLPPDWYSPISEKWRAGP